MPKFTVPLKITAVGELTVEAENYQDAIVAVDNTLFWAYQAGDPMKTAGINFTGSEIEVDDYEVDLDEYREEPEE